MPGTQPELSVDVHADRPPLYGQMLWSDAGSRDLSGADSGEKDQRISRIYLTEKGKQAKEDGMKKVKENEKILLSGLSDAELCLLKRMLEQITENIDKIPGNSEKNDIKKVRQQK